jgi:hypothetical protein
MTLSLSKDNLLPLVEFSFSCVSISYQDLFGHAVNMWVPIYEIIIILFCGGYEKKN